MAKVMAPETPFHSWTACLTLYCQQMSHIYPPLAWKVLPCHSIPCSWLQGHSPNSLRTMVTTAELELLAWASAVPVEKPSIWALTLVWPPAQTPGTRKVPWVSLVAMVPGLALRKTLAPGSGRPDGVTTEPKRMWSGHLQVSELHPKGTWGGKDRELVGRALHSIIQQTCNTPPQPIPLGLQCGWTGVRDEWAQLDLGWGWGRGWGTDSKRLIHKRW